MNICYLSLDYPSRSGGGGVGSQVRTLGRALVACGHRVTAVALRSPGQPKLAEDDGVRVARFRQGALHWYLSKLPLAGPWLALGVRELERAWGGWRVIRRLHAETPFDVIEITETGGLLVTLFVRDVPVVARLHGERYTVHKHTPDLPLTVGVQLARALQRIALRRARLLSSPSHAHAREIAAELGPRHPPIEVVPNVVARPDAWASPVDASPVEGYHGLDGDAPLVLYVGRLERGKGVPLLLEAARRVLDEMPEAQFALAGGDHPTLARAEIEALIERHALNGAVHLLGHVPHQALAWWYRRASLCVLPSYYETFGIAALEPMAFGVPVVATTAGGLPEVVDDGVSGVLVPPGDASSVARVTIQLLRDDREREKMGGAAKYCVECNLDFNLLLDRNLSIYRGIAAQ